MKEYADVEFVVEADDFARDVLWDRHSSDPVALQGTRYKKVSWESETSGLMPTIGKVGKRPVVLSIFCAKVNGRRVMFWWPCSQVVDHKQVEAWLTANVPAYALGNRCDAQNFHICLQHVSQPRTGPVVLGIEYDEGAKDPASTYKGVSIRERGIPVKLVNSGDPQVDYLAAQMFVGEDRRIMHSSTVDHFVMDGGTRDLDANPTPEVVAKAEKLVARLHGL